MFVDLIRLIHHYSWSVLAERCNSDNAIQSKNVWQNTLSANGFVHIFLALRYCILLSVIKWHYHFKSRKYFYAKTRHPITEHVYSNRISVVNRFLQPFIINIYFYLTPYCNQCLLSKEEWTKSLHYQISLTNGKYLLENYIDQGLLNSLHPHEQYNWPDKFDPKGCFLWNTSFVCITIGEGWEIIKVGILNSF